jgi:hypothetical protein
LTLSISCKLDSIKGATIESNNKESTMLEDEIADFAYKIKPKDKLEEDENKVSSTREDDKVIDESDALDSNGLVAALDEE